MTVRLTQNTASKRIAREHCRSALPAGDFSGQAARNQLRNRPGAPMKSTRTLSYKSLLLVCAFSSWLAGCASTDHSSAPSGNGSTRYKADDGRTIDIGLASTAEGGRQFKNRHMEK